MAGQAQAKFDITFWGVRGSVPCCGDRVAKYGGNTACVEVNCGDTRIIFDAGSGLRNLGQALAERAPVSAYLFLSHFHLDHIMGLPFFAPFYDAQNSFKLLAGNQGDTCCLKSAMGRLFSPPLMPVCVETFKAKVAFQDIVPGKEVDLTDEIKVRSVPLNHPDGALGYRVEFGGRAMCYITDTEHDLERPDENILGLIDGADLCIYDTTFTDEEFATHVGFGHSTYQEGLRLAHKAGVKTFMPFHYHPTHDDAFLDGLMADLGQGHPALLPAREGATVTIG